MGKRTGEKDTLAVLIVSAMNLQAAMAGLRDFQCGNDEIVAAYDGARVALNRIIVEILRNHRSEVTVRLDPRQSQVWGNRRAVLEVVYGSIILRIPVPMLRSRDAEICEKIRGKIMNTSIFDQAIKFAQAKADELGGQYHFQPQMGPDPDPDPNNQYPPEVCIGREYQVWKAGGMIGCISIPDEGPIEASGVLTDFKVSE